MEEGGWFTVHDYIYPQKAFSPKKGGGTKPAAASTASAAAEPRNLASDLAKFYKEEHSKVEEATQKVSGQLTRTLSISSFAAFSLDGTAAASVPAQTGGGGGGGRGGRVSLLLSEMYNTTQTQATCSPPLCIVLYCTV